MELNLQHCVFIHVYKHICTKEKKKKKEAYKGNILDLLKPHYLFTFFSPATEWVLPKTRFINKG